MAELQLSAEESESIIVEAKRVGAYEGVIPQEDAEKIKSASEIVGFAIDAFMHANIRGDEVTSILGLARVTIEGDSWFQLSDSWVQIEESAPAEADVYPETDEPWEGYDSCKVPDVLAQFEDEMSLEQIQATQEYEKAHKARKKVLDYKPLDSSQIQQKEELDEGLSKAVQADPDPVEPREGASPQEAAYEQRELGIAEARKRGLPIPRDIPNGQAPQMPFDLTDVGDDQLMKLHSQFNACLAAANWTLGLYTVDYMAYRNIADHHAIKNKRVVNRDGKSAAAVDRALKESETEDNVLYWRDKQHVASYVVESFERLVKIYEKNIDVLSRQWSYREKMLLSSGNLNGRT